MSRFPKLTETFVLYEIIAMDEAGVPVEVFPLLRERQALEHPDVASWVDRAHFQPFLSPGILRAHAHYLRRSAGRYLGALREALAGTWGSLNFFMGALVFFPKAVRFALDMEQRGVTHIHAHFATHPALVALVIHRLTGIPFSFTAHGSDLHVDRRMLPQKVEESAFTVAVSAFNREVIVTECGEHVRSRVEVVHCGVDPNVFVPSGAPREPGPFRMVCVASFEEVKGHRYLVDAVGTMLDRGVACECHLVGDGPGRSAIEAQIRQLGIAAGVRIHGPKPRPFVAQLLASADAAVLASHPTREGKREGIPVALMEAMSAGLPVVATAISGIPELVIDGETGFLVEPRDSDALADRLCALAADHQLRVRMGAAGRARVEQQFDLRANSTKLLRLFRERGRSTSRVAAAAANRVAPSIR
jgi:colanic acid/amylovoran biosynthesis glycosyltransferase